MTETNYLNPDLEVIAEINTPESFATFAESINTGHGIVGTTHAEDVERLVNRVVEQGLPAYLLKELDLLVFPKRVDGERYVGRVVELVDDPPEGRGGTVRQGDTAVHWRRVGWRDTGGQYHFDRDAAFFDAVGDRTDRPRADVIDEFERKHRYVRYLQREGVDDFETLFSFLADLRTDEAATVEQVASAGDTDRVTPDDGIALDGGGDPGDLGGP
jgi:hypothetical protein